MGLLWWMMMMLFLLPRTPLNLDDIMLWRGCRKHFIQYCKNRLWGSSWKGLYGTTFSFTSIFSLTNLFHVILIPICMYQYCWWHLERMFIKKFRHIPRDEIGVATMLPHASVQSVCSGIQGINSHVFCFVSGNGGTFSMHPINVFPLTQEIMIGSRVFPQQSAVQFKHLLLIDGVI